MKTHRKFWAEHSNEGRLKEKGVHHEVWSVKEEVWQESGRSHGAWS